MKKYKIFTFIFVICLGTVIFSNCEEDAFGNSNLALFSNAELLSISRAQYDEEMAKYRNQGKLLEDGPQYEMIQRIGQDIKQATTVWLQRQGTISQISNYYWEFALINDRTVNAWAMPGALIVFYTGILPVCENEAAVATVMGHEVAHALLNHAQKRMTKSAGWSIVGEIVGSILGSELAALAITLGANLRLLQYSRDNEYEADDYGQRLMAIAGYNPDEAAPFWERMAALSSSSLEFLSTHPDPDKRTSEMRKNAPAAKALAAEFGVTSFKPQTPVP